MILKSMCFKELALGDVLQILNIIITMERWILHLQSAWQLITITVAESNTDVGTGSVPGAIESSYVREIGLRWLKLQSK